MEVTAAKDNDHQTTDTGQTRSVTDHSIGLARPMTVRARLHKVESVAEINQASGAGNRATDIGLTHGAASGSVKEALLRIVPGTRT